MLFVSHDVLLASKFIKFSIFIANSGNNNVLDEHVYRLYGVHHQINEPTVAWVVQH